MKFQFTQKSIVIIISVIFLISMNWFLSTYFFKVEDINEILNIVKELMTTKVESIKTEITYLTLHIKDFQELNNNQLLILKEYDSNNLEGLRNCDLLKDECFFKLEEVNTFISLKE